MGETLSPDAGAPRLLTIGHSNLAFAAFLDRLQAHAVRAVADIRRFAGSRRWPQFGAEALRDALAAAGIAYRHFPALGGRRPPQPDSPNRGWQNAGFRSYADYMQTAEFAAALAELEAWARQRLTVAMCAEALAWRCHRRLLGDALLLRGWRVEHILGRGPASPAALTPFARVVNGQLLYPGAEAERLDEARDQPW